MLLPELKKASKNNESAPKGSQRAVVVNMSSVLGSITQNNQGGFYPYRASKVILTLQLMPCCVAFHSIH